VIVVKRILTLVPALTGLAPLPGLASGVLSVRFAFLRSGLATKHGLCTCRSRRRSTCPSNLWLALVTAMWLDVPLFPAVVTLASVLGAAAGLSRCAVG
jgi:hypothetical protein